MIELAKDCHLIGKVLMCHPICTQFDSGTYCLVTQSTGPDYIGWLLAALCVLMVVAALILCVFFVRELFSKD